ncbi:macro domain-containing protein [Gammaproteobacteria bacterium]|jgi:O-acetyl-ADP-ribose deacetylase|nr:macro domain-containing protein [Gammaproteobacteria bacterium]
MEDGERQFMLQIVVGDILKSKADVIVFSAHPSLLAGSGVSGVIHKAAGPELEKAARLLGPLSPGEAVITPAFNLSTSYIIHAVCPRCIYGTLEEERGLAQAYKSALDLKREMPEATRIAFVSMGTGVYKWPLELAADIAVNALVQSRFEATSLYVLDEVTRRIYQQACKNYFLNR